MSIALRKLVDNIFSFTVSRAIKYITPLILVPYLTRTIGIERFGLISFAEAFIQYFFLLTDYGFNLTATKNISINRHNPEKITEIFSAVLFAKIGFAILSFLTLCIVIQVGDKFKHDWLLYVLTFGTVIGNVFYFLWFFQGIEQVRPMVILSGISSIVLIIATLIFVKSPGDYIYVPLINSIASISSGLLGLVIIMQKFKIKLVLPKLNWIRCQLKEGWYVFLSTISINLYSNTNIFILGLLATNEAVGVYKVAFMIAMISAEVLSPISSSIYPYLSKVAHESREQAVKHFSIIFKKVFWLYLMSAAGIYLFAAEIAKLTAGVSLASGITPLLKIFSVFPIIQFFCTYGTILLLVFNLNVLYFKITAVTAAFNVIAVLVLTPILLQYGTAIAFITATVILAIMSWQIITKIMKSKNNDIRILGKCYSLEKRT